MCPFTQSSSKGKQHVPKSGFPSKEKVKGWASPSTGVSGEYSCLGDCGFVDRADRCVWPACLVWKSVNRSLFQSAREQDRYDRRLNVGTDFLGIKFRGHFSFLTGNKPHSPAVVVKVSHHALLLHLLCIAATAGHCRKNEFICSNWITIQQNRKICLAGQSVCVPSGRRQGSRVWISE